MDVRTYLKKKKVAVSVPCRIDVGGTLDIYTFSLALHHLNPCTFNIALDMRTMVSLGSWEKGRIKISSKGFDSAEFNSLKAPFDHPMGLMFAVARYFNADGIHIEIDSSSPPKSALGGSSSAAVAIAAAFLSCTGKKVNPCEAAVIAHYIESSVAGVPCGFQDQLAAAFGGVNVWYWLMGEKGPYFKQKSLFASDNDGDILNRHILVAYCGIPHVSRDVNSRWVKAFLSGRHRDTWEEIVRLTRAFSEAVKLKEFALAGKLMNQETSLRLSMTPDVLDKTGKALYARAEQLGCGARFTGAGGGGCVWAVGNSTDIEKLKPAWQALLAEEKQAGLLDAGVDPRGIEILL
ncbi:MAG: galactokinase [Desulfobacteraceae bacterium]